MSGSTHDQDHLAVDPALLNAAYNQAAHLSSHIEDLTVTDYSKQELPAADESFQEVDILGDLSDSQKREALFNAMNEISLSADTMTVEGLAAVVQRRDTEAQQQKEVIAHEAERKIQDDRFMLLEPEARAKAKEQEHKEQEQGVITASRRPTKRRATKRFATTARAAKRPLVTKIAA